MTLDDLIERLQALRVDDAAGALNVEINQIENFEQWKWQHDFRLIGVEKVRWDWGDGRTTINLKLLRTER